MHRLLWDRVVEAITNDQVSCSHSLIKEIYTALFPVEWQLDNIKEFKWSRICHQLKSLAQGKNASYDEDHEDNPQILQTYNGEDHS